MTKKKTLDSHNPLFLLAILAMFVIAAYFLMTGDFNVYKSKTTGPKYSQVTEVSPTFNFIPQNQSGITGVVSLSATGGQTKVTAELENASQFVTHPIHVHGGTCEDLGDVLYPLNEVEEGSSVSVIDTTIEDLMQMQPISINVHKSASQLSTYIACADLSF